jgi:acetate kinase
MNVLVINCGSSSLKYQLIDSATENVLAKGLCERIGLDGRLVYQPAGGEKETTDAAMPTHN